MCKLCDAFHASKAAMIKLGDASETVAPDKRCEASTVLARQFASTILLMLEQINKGTGE